MPLWELSKVKDIRKEDETDAANQKLGRSLKRKEKVSFLWVDAMHEYGRFEAVVHIGRETLLTVSNLPAVSPRGESVYASPSMYSG